MSHVKNLTCRECGHTYDVQPIHVCEFCFGPLEVSYDYNAISKELTRDTISNGPANIWRYAPLLPVDYEFDVGMDTGMTPLTKANNLGKLLGLNQLYIKNDSVNPTFSFKDRVVSVATAKALEFDFDTLNRILYLI